MVIRLVAVSDQLQLPEFHDISRAILGRDGDLGYIIRIHGQEFSQTRSKALHEFKLHRQEKFLYVCDTLHMWEWGIRGVDVQGGVEANNLPLYVGGRGAAPPEFWGGPTGYYDSSLRGPPHVAGTGSLASTIPHTLFRGHIKPGTHIQPDFGPGSGEP